MSSTSLACATVTSTYPCVEYGRRAGDAVSIAHRAGGCMQHMHACMHAPSMVCMEHVGRATRICMHLQGLRCTACRSARRMSAAAAHLAHVQVLGCHAGPLLVKRRALLCACTARDRTCMGVSVFPSRLGSRAMGWRWGRRRTLPPATRACAAALVVLSTMSCTVFKFWLAAVRMLSRVTLLLLAAAFGPASFAGMHTSADLLSASSATA